MNCTARHARRFISLKRRRLNDQPAEPAHRQCRPFHRPSFAPKPVLDIKHITQCPGLYEQNCRDRNYPAQADNPWKIISLRKQRAQAQHDATQFRQRARAVEKEIAAIKAGKHYDAAQVARIQELVAEAGALRATLDQHTAREAALDAEVQALALALPNLSSAHTPVGSTPRELDSAPPPPALRAKTASHVDIGAALDLLDFGGAARTSGWGFYILRNEGALLEQALVAYALSELRASGWTLVAPPHIVYAHVAAACGFAPRDQHGETQIYALEGPAAGGDDRPAHVLAATAEIPLAGMQAGRELAAAELPLRTAGVSRCFRAEAGARGVDTKGLYRVHEFTKVEMFAWTAPPGDDGGDGGVAPHFDAGAPPSTSTSDALLAEMLALQTRLLRALGLSFRVLEMPSADLGASAARKIDVEVFFPGRQGQRDGGFGEVTSASACGDFQARRLGARVRRAGGGALGWPGTVNGTALAVPRVLAAVLETHFDEASGTVAVPECLWPWMMGVRVIGAGKTA